MLTPKKMMHQDVDTSKEINETATVISLKDNDEMLVFENGTVLGAVIEALSSESTSINNNSELNEIPKIKDNENLVQNNNNTNTSVSTSTLTSSNNTLSTNSIPILIDQIIAEGLLDDVNNGNNNNSINISSAVLERNSLSDINNCSSIQNNNQMDLLNSSTCSRESRQSNNKRSRRKSLLKKSNQPNDLYGNRYPPQYTAIYLDTAGSGITIGRSYDSLNQIHQQLDGGNSDGVVGGAVGNGTTSDEIQRRGYFRQWFSRPSLPFVIGVLALGGVACTLGGIVLGSTGLVEHSTQYLSAALLMIGIGVSLLVISGAIWRLSIPDETENCPCFRHMETCRNCNSPYCNNRLLPAGFMYPEFQHRPPPPSYVTSLNECTVGLLLHHEVANLQRNDTIRIATPPPAYRSSQSLSVFVPLHTTMNTNSRTTFRNPSSNRISSAASLSSSSSEIVGVTTSTTFPATMSTVNNPYSYTKESPPYSETE